MYSNVSTVFLDFLVTCHPQNGKIMLIAPITNFLFTQFITYVGNGKFLHVIEDQSSLPVKVVNKVHTELQYMQDKGKKSGVY